jgi:hypothetical protein
MDFLPFPKGGKAERRGKRTKIVNSGGLPETLGRGEEIRNF